MKRWLGTVLIVAVVIAAAGSCSRRARVIPVRKMEKIYRDMFLADQWLADNPSVRKTADTTWFYEPIFEKYGYNRQDYIKSVDHYLNDPKRYAEMLGRVSKDLKDEAEGLEAAIERRERLKFRADSAAQARKALVSGEFVGYSDLFLVTSMTDRIDIRKNHNGIYYPVPVVEDTMFRGPEMIIRDSVAETVIPEPLGVPWKE